MTMGIAGEYENRSEYHSNAHERRVLSEQALESIEDLLLTEKGTSTTGMYYTYEDDIVTRNMKLSHAVKPTEEAEHIFVDDDGTISIRQIQRRAAHIDIEVQAQRFRKGALHESTEVSIQESVYGFRTLLLTRYIIEQYAGGDMRAYIDHPDLTDVTGHELREMIPYDFSVFEKHMKAIIAVRKGVLVGNLGTGVEVNF